MSDANHIAQKHGEVRYFRHDPAMIWNVIICIAGLVTHVRFRRVERIRITPKWLERDAPADFAGLRFIASSPEISRELWIYMPEGTFRFSRVLGNSLAESMNLNRRFPLLENSIKSFLRVLLIILIHH